MPSPLVTSVPVHAAAMLAEGHLPQSFDIAVASSGLCHVRRCFLATRDVTIAQLESGLGLSVEASLETHGQLLVVGQVGDRELLEVSVQHGSGSIRAAADSIELVDSLLERARTWLVAEDRPEDPRVPITFWTLAEHGPEPMRRRLHAPSWSEIAPNYVGPVREALAQVMAAPPETARGIALWRGAPGTGKTTALRALAQEWREHVEVHVIVDPEVFLGERASYLVEVLFGHDVDEPWEDEDVVVHVEFAGRAGMHPHLPGPVAPTRPRARAKLIVLEDAGELISADARVSAGQALSRLLNLTDGMLGQGANVSVLVTTNEPIDRLHGAVARPGRSWAHIEFGQLPQGEANAWLEQHGVAERVDGPASIAELYGLLRGDQVVTLDALDR
jgi:hypothetical protein